MMAASDREDGGGGVEMVASTQQFPYLEVASRELVPCSQRLKILILLCPSLAE